MLQVRISTSGQPEFIRQRAVAFIFNLKEITLFSCTLCRPSSGFVSILSFDRVCFPSFGFFPSPIL